VIGDEPVAYTDRQIKLIRDRLKTYQLVQHAGPQRMTWLGVCGRIFHEVKVRMDEEVLRQFVEKVSRKGRPDKPRIPSPRNLKAIVDFLSHEEIDMLSAEELKEPDIPFALIQLFLEYLKPDEHSEIFSPPYRFAGIFNSVCLLADKSSRIDVELTLRIDDGNHFIRVSEKLESYALPSETAHAEASPKMVPTLQNRRFSDGWAILTPEDNIVIFMKQKPYAHNHFYTTIALTPGLWSETSARQLVVLRHEYPAEPESFPEAVENILNEAGSDMMCLRFTKTEVLDDVVDGEFIEVSQGETADKNAETDIGEVR
jgi:hypothetical protein